MRKRPPLDRIAVLRNKIATAESYVDLVRDTYGDEVATELAARIADDLRSEKAWLASHMRNGSR